MKQGNWRLCIETLPEKDIPHSLTTEEPKRATFYGTFIWSLAVLYYLFEFFLGVIPGTLSKALIRDLGLSAEEFAILGSVFFFTYSSMQTIVGFLFDRYGARLLLTVASGTCALGVFKFATADGFFSCAISRMLIGFGASFSFVFLLVLALQWFPRKYFPFLAGLGQVLGSAGPLMAGAPVVFWMRKMDMDWRQVLMQTGAAGVLLTLLTALFVRNRPALKHSPSVQQQKIPLLTKLKYLTRNPQVLATMFYTGSVYVSLPMLGAYWGIYYLETRGFDPANAAFMVSMIWVGLAIGSPCIGSLSIYLQKRKPCLMASAGLGFFSSLAILYLPTQNQPLLCFLFILLGIAAGGQSLAFAVITDIVPRKMKGTAIGLNNTAISFFAATSPPLMTQIMQLKAKSARLDRESDFVIGLLIMPVMFLAAYLVSRFLMKETYCCELAQEMQ